MPVTNQTTIAEESSIVGTSLHTGKPVTLTLKPAPAGTGYVFLRNDLSDRPQLAADVSHVLQVERATTLSEGAVKIHTVEHLLSALRGMGVDNALIEMDSNEPPIGDGSAAPFAQLVKSAGIKELDTPRKYFQIKEPLYVTGKNDSYIAALPYDGLKVSCTNANHTGQFTQYLSLEVNAESYERELAPSRTFVFFEEIEQLLEKGLIKGGSLENAIVVRDGSILSKDPMRFEDEFVRHKILDVIGDLALFPVPVKAHFIAARPSHELNVEMAKLLAKEYKDYLSRLIPMEDIPVGEGGLEIDEVMRILPHRYPFLMVDRVVAFHGENRVTASKNVTMNEEFFQGHFPQQPIMPGVLQVEAMAQAASILLLRQAENAGKIGYFMSLDKVKFRRPVRPGDTLIIQVELLKYRGKIGKAVGQCEVKGEVVSEGELTFVIQ